MFKTREDIFATVSSSNSSINVQNFGVQTGDVEIWRWWLPKLICSTAGIIQFIQESLCIVEGLGKQGEGGGAQQREEEGGAQQREEEGGAQQREEGGEGDELGKLSTVV